MLQWKNLGEAQPRGRIMENQEQVRQLEQGSRQAEEQMDQSNRSDSDDESNDT